MSIVQKVIEYDQEIPQSHTADQPKAPEHVRLLMEVEDSFYLGAPE